MHLTRRTWWQLGVLAVITATAVSYMLFGLMRVPASYFDIGRYDVTVQLPAAAGLYERANVTYRGTEVGIVKGVNLTDTGVEAVLSLRSDIRIPANLRVGVHSNSAVGEQYVALSPLSGDGPVLKNGDVIAEDRSSVPPDINSLLDATNRGLEAIPGDDLRTAVDESYVALAGLGPELNRFIKSGSQLAIDSKAVLPEQLNVVDNLAPLLDTQTETSNSVQNWAAHLANITGQLRDHDEALRGIVSRGGYAADELNGLFARVQPVLPVLAANLASVAPVLVTYQPNLEQLLVLLPQGIAGVQAISLANRGTRQGYKGGFLSFNLNTNLPPPCTTGFLPVQQQRASVLEDYPDRPAGDLYCRIPQDSPFNVRGARNIPCVTRPGKRAPTVKMCESDENYVPLNDGLNWKGDPNATTSGQAIPQLEPGAARQQADSAASVPPSASPPIAVAGYDPVTGIYVGPDGRVYTQTNLSAASSQNKSWQGLLLPPGS
jgi:phospholipid/cholesterol/gamma-HCH transport system substrate-binding protein